MTNKEAYRKFVEVNDVAVYSKPWWMDAVCGPDNWDVWLYRKGSNILAAMPYYTEQRGPYRYITKAPLTQTNGIVFSYDEGAKIQKRASFEEKVVDAMTVWLKEEGFDVYEQQYSHSFKNWQPFFWNGFKCIVRYTYVLENTADMDRIMDGYSAKLRNDIKKGRNNATSVEELAMSEFYSEHEKIYAKQNMPCPFSFDLWRRLYCACREHDSGATLCVRNQEGRVSSLAFFVWDENYVYLLMGGAIPDLSSENTFSYLVHTGIELASKKGKGFDFEGSMIKRIAKAYRDFGGIPTPYYRIRRLFHPGVIRMEAESEIAALQER